MQKENEDKGKNGGKENDGSKNKEEKTMYTNSQPITEFLREEIKKSTKWWVLLKNCIHCFLK